MAREVHLHDPALVDLEEKLDRELAQLRVLSAAIPAERARCANGESLRAERAEVFARAVRDLERAGIDAGLEVRERLAIRGRSAWSTTAIRFGWAGPSVAALEAALGRVRLPEGAWIEAAGCGRGECTAVLSAATIRLSPVASYAQPPPRSPSLPAKPWWPPDARRWERIRELQDERLHLLPALNDLGRLQRVQEDADRMEDVLRVLRSARFAADVLDCVSIARAAGAREFEVARVDGALQVTTAAPVPDLELRLRSSGFTVANLGTTPVTTYRMRLRYPERNGGEGPGMPPGTSLYP